MNNTATAPPRHSRIIIIGSGFSGLGLAIQLSQQGRHDFLVLERGKDLGGSWRDNTYPGAACDVPSSLYSYSFAPGGSWTRGYSRQGEILDYLRDVARRYRVLDRHVFDCEVRHAHWDAADRGWQMETPQGRFTADILVSAVGPLHEPARPDIAGLESFTGDVLHSASWEHDVSLDGRRVAVIGTGASAVQIVPELASRTAHLDVYQRTPPWLLPKLDRSYTRIERLAFRHLPGYARLLRGLAYLKHEFLGLGMARHPVWLGPMQWAARADSSPGTRSASAGQADT